MKGLTLFKTPIPISSSVVSEPSTYEDDEYGSGLWAGTKLYIVIACISALVLVAIVQATCTLCKMRSKTAKNQVKVRSDGYLGPSSRIY